MSEEPQPGHWQIAIPLLLVLYLFIIANTLFGGMFSELDDRALHTYRPEDTPALIEQILAFITTAGPLLIGAAMIRRWHSMIAVLSNEERLIVYLLVALVIGTALRSGGALLLRLEIGTGAGMEALILGVQILASVVLIGGGLRLLQLNMGADDTADGEPNEQPGE